MKKGICVWVWMWMCFNLGLMAQSDVMGIALSSDSIPTLIDVEDLYSSIKSIDFDTPGPSYVDASDGLFNTYVKIKWDKVVDAKAYKLFRSTSPEAIGLKEIKGWQEETFHMDYSAVPGVKYFYYIVALTPNNQMTQIDKSDSGYIYTDKPIATLNPLYGILGNTFEDIDEEKILVSKFMVYKRFAVMGKPYPITYYINNMSGKTIDKLQIRCYLSDDKEMDWNDTLLFDEWLTEIDPTFPSGQNKKIELPTETKAGEKYLILVASPNGKIEKSVFAYRLIRIQE